VNADVMVVTPHPDDAEYGAAGTVARMVKEGKKVAYVVCTNGDKGTSDINTNPKELAIIREKEQIAACKVLGVKEVAFLRHPDQSLEDTHEFRKEIVCQIRKYRPQIVITANPYRHYIWHRDHRIAGQVTLDAVFPYARDHLTYPELLEKDLKPHKVKEVFLWASNDVNYISDISKTFQLKIAALRCHKSQIGTGEQAKKVEDWVRNMNLDMAKGKNFEIAEAFHLVELPE
jgi:LmbE family N-acetylglucosaminyl deacetylase